MLMKIKDNIKKKLYEKLNDRINTTHTYSYFGRIYLYLLEEYRDEKKWARSIEGWTGILFRYNPVYGICIADEEKKRNRHDIRTYSSHSRYVQQHQLCKLAHKLNDQWPIKITLHCLWYFIRSTFKNNHFDTDLSINGPIDSL